MEISAGKISWETTNNEVCRQTKTIARTANRRFGNMAGRRIYTQLFVRYQHNDPIRYKGKATDWQASNQ